MPPEGDDVKPLNEMTLAELFNQRAQWDLMSAPERAAWYDERDRRQAMLDAAEGMAMAIPMEIGGLWEVAEYDEQQIEIMAHKEMHVAFLNNTITGRRFAQHIVALHNFAYAAAKGER